MPRRLAVTILAFGTLHLVCSGSFWISLHSRRRLLRRPASARADGPPGNLPCLICFGERWIFEEPRTRSVEVKLAPGLGFVKGGLGSTLPSLRAFFRTFRPAFT